MQIIMSNGLETSDAYDGTTNIFTSVAIEGGQELIAQDLDNFNVTINSDPTEIQKIRPEIEKINKKYQFSTTTNSFGHEEDSLVIPYDSTFEELFTDIKNVYNQIASKQQIKVLPFAINLNCVKKLDGFSEKIADIKGLKINGFQLSNSLLNESAKEIIDNNGKISLKDNSDFDFYALKTLDIIAIGALKLINSIDLGLINHETVTTPMYDGFIISSDGNEVALLAKGIDYFSSVTKTIGDQQRIFAFAVRSNNI